MSGSKDVAGVNYERLDWFKRFCQRSAVETNVYAERFGLTVEQLSRGESAFLIRVPESMSAYIAHVDEGVGTKIHVSDALYERRNDARYYAAIAQDCVASSVNDLITSGALPMSTAMHLSVGSAGYYFGDEMRGRGLAEGFRDACHEARCVWGGGETAELEGLVFPEKAVLSSSVLGMTCAPRWWDPLHIQPGDAIILLESSGVHTNGFTRIRHDILPKLKEGYMTEVLGTGSHLGELLSVPSHIYAQAVDLCERQGIEVHYAVHVSGHGWRKFIRALRNYTYEISKLPRQQPLFDFMQDMLGFSEREMYGAFNMGAGFALIMRAVDADRFLASFEKRAWPYRAMKAGEVKKGKRRVVIDPIGVEFDEKDLQIRA